MSASEPAALTLSALHFDGKSARAQPVSLRFSASGVVVSGEAGEWSLRPEQFSVSEALGATPRSLMLADGQSFEVGDVAALARALRLLGRREAAVTRWQQSWRGVLAALVATVLLVLAAYQWGLPALSRGLAGWVPPAVGEHLSRQTLAFLDRGMTSPSQLPEERRAALLSKAQQWFPAPAPGLPAWRLHFRAASLGPNALALPNGDIVAFDALVDLAEDDERVLAVIAHELGHVAQRHGLRQLIQSSLVGFVAGVYFGDLSSLVSGLAAGLLEAGYSRAFELEADAYAVARLRALGREPRLLAEMLQRLEAAHAAASGVPATSRSPGWLDSHPDTAERVARILAVD